MYTIHLLPNTSVLQYAQQLSTVGGGRPAGKCHVKATVLGTEEESLLRTSGDVTEDSDTQPFLHSTRVCPLHYFKAYLHPTLAILLGIHKVFFGGKGLKIQIRRK